MALRSYNVIVKEAQKIVEAIQAYNGYIQIRSIISASPVITAAVGKLYRRRRAVGWATVLVSALCK
jgi:hypothetical protein